MRLYRRFLIGISCTLLQVWSHFDNGSCPGSAIGVRCRLDNGCTGFIHIKNLSDKKVTDPLERVKVSGCLQVDT